MNASGFFRLEQYRPLEQSVLVGTSEALAAAVLFLNVYCIISRAICYFLQLLELL